tara:strand:+ start:902 stop:1213 length:312 start_codon:yes stop_codon:yes gene_type:complete
MPTFQEMMAGAKDEARKLGACPMATQDQAANDANEQRAVAQADYKPADTEQRCGNCGHFDQSDEMMVCIKNGSTVPSGPEPGYCRAWDFLCTAAWVCNSWKAQ